MPDYCDLPEPPHRPGDVQVTAPNGFDCGWPSYGNLHTGRYADGGAMCGSGAHPVQSPEDIAAMHPSGPATTYGALGFHCEANAAPPPPWSPWPAIGVGVVLLVALFAPRIWRAAKPVLRFGGWRL